MVDKELIKELLLKNPANNNVQISNEYASIKGITINTETFRKNVQKVRKKMKMGNPASKHTSKKFYNTGFEKVQTAEDENKSQYRYTKVDPEKGTMLSEIVISFEPRNDEELAKLHRVDLNKYRISNYWTKLQPNGNFTSSLLCTLKKVGDSIDLGEAKKILTESLSKDNKIIYKPKLKLENTNNKALMFWIADEHVGASVSGSIYENKYDKNEYYRRKSKIVDLTVQLRNIHGDFDKIIVCSLGDNLDGFNGKTTRSLTGAPTHGLEQNMTNQEAIKTYVDVNKIIYDSIVDLNATNNIELYNVNNSNHGGLGFDYMGAFALRQYLETKHGNLFKITDFDKIIDKFTYGDFNFYLTHGKDDTHMKRNFPFQLNPTVEGYFKEFIDDRKGSKLASQNIVVKGDLHRFGTEQSKWFMYQNCPSLFGSSAWVHANFGKGMSGFAYSVVGKTDTSMSFHPVWNG